MDYYAVFLYASVVSFVCINCILLCFAACNFLYDIFYSTYANKQISLNCKKEWDKSKCNDNYGYQSDMQDSHIADKNLQINRIPTSVIIYPD